MLSKKKDQTYEEALKAMTTVTCPMHYLTEISKRHYTPELLTAAIRHSRCQLSQIPEELRTKDICREILKARRSEDVQLMPREHFDYEFSLECVSYCPTALTCVLYFFRSNRRKESYTKEDMSIIAEAACPRKLGGMMLDRMTDPDEEPKDCTFEEWCSREYGFTHPSTAFLIYQALVDSMNMRKGEFPLAETSLGTLVAKSSSDSLHPGIYIDLRRDDNPCDAPVAVVECTQDEADLDELDHLITRVWDDVSREEYTTRVVHSGVEQHFAAKQE